jgi:hypothetical protein
MSRMCLDLTRRQSILFRLEEGLTLALHGITKDTSSPKSYIDAVKAILASIKG